MLIAMFDLNEVDIQALKLNDKIYIDNSWWNINKVQDYNANNNSLTKVELISIDTEIDLARYKTANGKPIGDIITAIGMDSIFKKSAQVNNVVLPGADVIVLGKGNVVGSGVKALVIGDGQVVDNDGIVTNNLTVTGIINGAPVVNYKKYIALISQTGILDPVATVLENTIGDIVWTRIGVGEYLGTLTGAFSAQDKVYCISGNNDFDSTSLKWNSVNDVVLWSFDNTHTPIDAALNYTTIEIRVY
jgi:hypothetical protein